jgi:hypothetical protein
MHNPVGSLYWRLGYVPGFGDRSHSYGITVRRKGVGWIVLPPGSTTLFIDGHDWMTLLVIKVKASTCSFDSACLVMIVIRGAIEIEGVRH